MMHAVFFRGGTRACMHVNATTPPARGAFIRFDQESASSSILVSWTMLDLVLEVGEGCGAKAENRSESGRRGTQSVIIATSTSSHTPRRLIA